jgi:ELWxxDGT repeat protein
MEKKLPSIVARKWSLAIASFTLMLLAAAVSAQPVLVKDLTRPGHSFVTANGQLFFAEDDSLITGNAGALHFVKDLNEQILFISEETIGNKVFIVTTNGTANGLWVSTGTSASTIKIANYPLIRPLKKVGTDLYLVIDNGSNGQELWKLNSSNALMMLKDINPGAASSFGTVSYQDNASYITVSNGQVYFSATDATGKDLWRTDGTTAGTVKAVDMEFDTWFQLTDVNGTMFFERQTVDDYYGDPVTQLWKTQGTAASTVMVKDFGSDYQYNNLERFISYQGKLYFIHYHGIPQEDLWVSDGTTAGTTFMSALNIDGYLSYLVPVENYMVYAGNSQGFNHGIYKIDLTNGARSEVRTLNRYFETYNGQEYLDITVAGDRLYFIEHSVPESEYPSEPDKYVLFESTSPFTPATTKSMKDLYNFAYFNTKNITIESGNNIFFTTQDSEGAMKLWYYDPDNSACGTPGGLTREVWTNISGNNVTSIPLTTPPNRVEQVTSFAGPVNEGDRYGARYRGYLCVPVTGSYKFMIASDDYSELFLSTTAFPEQKRRIAYVHGATKRGEYTKYPSQQSAMITLQANTKYYIEATHKEGGTYDHIMVAMQYPNGTIENPIQGSHLIPFNNNKAPVVAITSPENNQEFAPGDNISITADASDSDGSIVKVEFYLNGNHYNNELLGSDATAPYQAGWYACCPEGTYTITAKAYDNAGGTSSSTITIHRIACSATGQIKREVWTNVTGQQVSTIPVSKAPTSTGYLTSLEGPLNAGDYYGARIRGYICPPTDGEYTFYISSDDHSELWLSTDADPANKRKIAYVFGATGRRVFTKYPTQTSVKIYLQRNKKYYVEVLHKENLGYDHVTVGWTLPNGLAQVPIPGSVLSPYEGGTAPTDATMARAATEQMAAEESTTEEMMVSLTPNPVKTGKVTLNTRGFNLDRESRIRVQVVSMTGEVIHDTEVSCGSDCNAVDIELAGKVRKGIYLVKGTVNGKLFTERMVVEE